MRLFCTFPPSRSLSVLTLSLGLLVVGTVPGWADDKLPVEKPVVLKEVPETLEDLKSFQSQIKKVLAKVVPATVGVRIGISSGSGIIIDKEGHVLTAAHVSGEPDVDVELILHDGTKVKGKTLGLNHDRDSGLIKIVDKGKFPFVERGKSADLKRGQWCIAVGHPNGYKPGRSPVVRVGRVQGIGKFITTDCALVGGDSGGPLFDLNGNVIGIHSRIANALVHNDHVPIDEFETSWARLARGDAWGGNVPTALTRNAPWMGIERDFEEERCIIKRVFPDSPAAKAGLKAEDLILKFDGAKIGSFEDLLELIPKKKIGDRVTVEVQRGKEVVKLEVVLGKRQS